jgi:site-specific recombinase XerD
MKHLSLRTEKAYTRWVRRFVRYHDLTHPASLGAKHVRAFLSYLATEQHVAASTQNQALSALLSAGDRRFLYKHVLEQELGDLGSVVRANRPKRRPVVLTRDSAVTGREVSAVMLHLKGTSRLAASLLYGSGLRLLESLRLRVKDVDFNYRQITVRDSKGEKDRVTMLPDAVAEPLHRHLGKVKVLHSDLCAETSAKAGDRSQPGMIFLNNLLYINRVPVSGTCCFHYGFG